VALHLVRRACELPEQAGRSLSQWDCAELARHLVRDEVVASISPQTVQRLLASQRLKPWRQHVWLHPRTPRDATFAAQVRVVADLLARLLDEHESVLSLDEMTSLQPRPRRVPTRPAQPGRPVQVEHEYRRAGATHLFAAFDTRSGQVYGVTARRKRQVEFVHADMYDFVRPNTFDLIVSIFSSIGYAEADDADRRLLENARRSLRPDGAIVVDMIGKELIGRTPERRWTRQDDEVILGEARIVDGWRWLEEHVTRIKYGRCTELVFRYRLYSAAELRALAEAAGFTRAAIYGSLRGRPYDRHASRLILLARP
jgi:SAM-dependent methyltransferase